MVIGAPLADGPLNALASAGESYVIFGAAFLPNVLDLSNPRTTGITITGARADDLSGFSVSSAGDVNADGFDDLLIGAVGADGPDNTKANAGNSYVIFGGDSLPITIDTNFGSAGITIFGASPGDANGSSVSSAGDVNGDGFGDLVVGAPGGDAEGNAKSGAGNSYLVFGVDSLLTLTHAGTAAANILTGTTDADVMNGGRGKDTLIGSGGRDVLTGGQGADVLAVSDLTFERLIGGAGRDTLRLDGSGLALDLTEIPDNRLLGIEQFSLDGSGNNSLILNQREVLNLSDESNTIVVFGNLGDTINILDCRDWTLAGSETIGAHNFHILTQGAATLKVEQAVNALPIGLPTITCSALTEHVLTAVTSDIFDLDGLGPYSYKWERANDAGFTAGVVTVGTNAMTYALGSVDGGKFIRVSVTYSDGDGTAEAPLISTSIGPVAIINHPAQGVPTVFGSLRSFEPLFADTSGISDADGLGTFTYQWQQANNRAFTTGVRNVGLNQSSYDGIADKFYRVLVTFTDANGNAESPEASTPVGPIIFNYPPIGGPAVTGSLIEDQVLTAFFSPLQDYDGVAVETLAYQWQRANDAQFTSGVVTIGTNAITYTQGDADVGKFIRVNVSYIDGHGLAEGPLASSALGPVVNNNDSPVGALTITGTPSEDQILTADTSGISDADGLGTFIYLWQQASNAAFTTGVATIGTGARTYTLGDADVGKFVRVRVIYNDSHGTAEGPLTSSTVGPIVNVNHPPIGLPTITGTATEDQILTAITSAISDIDSLGAFTYQWQRASNAAFTAGVVSVDTSATTYMLGDADVGKFVRVRVIYTDGDGTAEAIASASVGPVANVNDSPVGLPTITGLAVEDAVLTAVTSGISDADGLGAFTYQWRRANNNAFTIGAVSVGTNSPTYTLGDDDVGKYIRVRVTYADGHGTVEGTVFSASLGPIANVNDSPTSLAFSTDIVAENNAVGTLIGDFSTSDLDLTDTFTYTFVTGTGSADNGLFAIDSAGNLKTAAKFNFETTPSLSIRIRSTDQGGLFVEKIFTIRVANVLEMVGNVSIGTGEAQRSLVKQLVLTFDGPITLDPGAFEVTKRGAGGGSVTTNVSTVTSASQTIVTLTFLGVFTRGINGALVDGYYQLTVDGSKIHSGEQNVDFNGDGLGGDTYILGATEADSFFALFGDTNGDGLVGVAEFGQFRSSFGKLSNESGYNALFDYGGDGAVGVSDFGQFRSRFGRPKLAFS